jgi:putative intracellular protease/amidase
VVCGGSAWRQPEPPDIGPAARAARDAGRIVAGICDGTFALARAGLLDAVPHTGNGPEALDASGYGGKAHYRDVPGAVRAGGIVTAPGTAPVRFAEAVLEALGLGDDRLRYYVGLHARQYRSGTAITI